MAIEEKISKYLKDLTASFIKDGISYPDVSKRKKAISFISGLDEKHLDKKIYKKIIAALQDSPAFLSADYYEDDFYIDFASLGADFKIDYTGGYTFVDDPWLPKEIVKERTNFYNLLNFYLAEIYRNEALKGKIENINLPLMEFINGGMYDLSFNSSVLFRTIFEDTDLGDLNFYKSNLEQCVFNKCQIDDVCFTSVALNNAKFTDCEFTNCSISACNLKDVTFTNCRFEESRLYSLDPESIDFSTCTFNKCYFASSDFRLYKGLKQEDMNNCIGNGKIFLPEGINRPAFWPQKADLGTWREWLDSGDIVEGKGSLTYE